MSQPDPVIVDFNHPLHEAKAIKECLRYLETQTNNIGLPYTAHLIAVAASALGDSITLSQRAMSAGFEPDFREREGEASRQ